MGYERLWGGLSRRWWRSTSKRELHKTCHESRGEGGFELRRLTEAVRKSVSISLSSESSGLSSAPKLRHLSRVVRRVQGLFGVRCSVFVREEPLDHAEGKWASRIRARNYCVMYSYCTRTKWDRSHNIHRERVIQPESYSFWSRTCRFPFLPSTRHRFGPV
jgi:hypothetical protein